MCKCETGCNLSYILYIRPHQPSAFTLRLYNLPLTINNFVVKPLPAD